MMSCATCDSYNKGKGSKACTRCPEIKQLNILPRAMPCIDYVKLPREIIEALSCEDDPVDIYSILTIKESTIIFYLYTLNLTHQEAANHLNIDRSIVTKKNKYILDKLRAYMLSRN